MDSLNTLDIKNKIKNLVKFEITNYQLDYLTEAGENYGSILLKVDVFGETESLSLIVKLCPRNEIIKQAFLTNITFKKEAFGYTTTLEAIQEFQIKHNSYNEYFPKCFAAKLDEEANDSMIVLENLKPAGYKNVDRMIGFDLNSATIILQKLAHLHATVIALKVTDYEKFKSSIQPALTPVNVGSTMIDGFTDTFLHFAKKLHQLTPYIEKLEAIVEQRKKIGGLKFPIETNSDFYSMIHTDLWTNNIMVAQDEDENIQIKFVDLQLLEFGSIARDFLFFLFTSVQINVVDKYFEYLSNSYYYNFHQCLCDYHVEFISNVKYSRGEFYKEIDNVAPYELFHILFMLKPIFSLKGSVANLDEISKDDFGRKDNIGHSYTERLRFIVLTFAKNNWI